MKISDVIKKYKGCTLCPLHETAHTYVFHRGASPCDILFVGEAPGTHEDLSGLPFVGPSGDLLDKMIFLCRQELKDSPYVPKGEHNDLLVGITNIVCCRPLDENRKIRPPKVSEAKACNPRYQETIYATKPGLIVLLGSTAKKFHKIQKALAGIPTLLLKHPAYVLRKGGEDSYEFGKDLLTLTEKIEEIIYGKEEEGTHTELETNQKIAKIKKDKRRSQRRKAKSN